MHERKARARLSKIPPKPLALIISVFGTADRTIVCFGQVASDVPKYQALGLSCIFSPFAIGQSGSANGR